MNLLLVEPSKIGDWASTDDREISWQHQWKWNNNIARTSDRPGSQTRNGPWWLRRVQS